MDTSRKEELIKVLSIPDGGRHHAFVYSEWGEEISNARQHHEFCGDYFKSRVLSAADSDRDALTISLNLILELWNGGDPHAWGPACSNYRVVNTDNVGGDYPDESFVTVGLPGRLAKQLADGLNAAAGEHSPRFFKVVYSPPDKPYQLRPGFEP